MCFIEGREMAQLSGWRNIIICALLPVIAGCLITGTSRDARAQGAAPECKELGAKAEGAKVNDVYRVTDPAKKERAAEIGNKIAVALEKPAEFRAYANCLKKDVILYIDGQATGNKLAVPGSASNNELIFFLRPLGGAREFWTALFGRPDFDHRPASVTVGIEGQAPLPSDKKIDLIVLPPGWLLFWLVLFIGLIILFFKTARNSFMLRDHLLNPATSEELGAYSLSKLQGAWWFFIILASYLLIGIVTGDFSNSINSTAIILLGIGAGTVIGSAAIDASKLEQRKTELARAQGALLTAKAAAAPDPKAVALAQAQIDALNGKSEGWLRDILSDGNGINFHRFQLAAWTLVLSIIFVTDVYVGLAMPTFNQTLMGLLGLSAGTYLGLKIPEAIKPA